MSTPLGINNVENIIESDRIGREISYNIIPSKIE